MRIPSAPAALAVAVSSALASAAQAGIHRDAQGNVGYDTLEECIAAVNAGTAKFYEPFTSHPPLKRAGEATVEVGRLSDLTGAGEKARELGYDASGYVRGSCDLGVGRSNERDGVSRALIGKWVPFAPTMPINIYRDEKGQIVRATMQKCDNNFEQALPRPLGSVAVAAQDCFANVVIPPRFETRTEQVVKVPASKRFETIPPTFKTVTEQVMVQPETKRYIPVPATFKTVTETVVVRPESFREEPVPATFKTVTEQVMVKPESKRLEVVPATFKTVTERVMVAPERKELKVIPAVFEDREERVLVSPPTTRTETVPPTFRTVSEQVLVSPESIRYEPIALPLRTVSETVVVSPESKRIEVVPATYKTVTERVMVKAASKRLEIVPAEFETVTERVLVADGVREWKKGRAWIPQALAVRPASGFVVGADGRVEGARVDTSSARPAATPVPAAQATGGAAAAAAAAPVTLPSGVIGKDDEVWCLVELPPRYETIQKQVLKRAAATREVEVPAEFAEVTKQVIDRPASTREIVVPAVTQVVTRQVIDVERLRSQGYKFDEKGDLVAAPDGSRILRAASVPGWTGTLQAGPGAAAGKPSAVTERTAGAASGVEGYVREVKIPAVYRTETRQVVDRPASVRTVEVPAVYTTVKKRVLVKPETTEEIVIPASYTTVTRQVVDQPATTREVVIPAEFRTVTRQVVDQPATTRRILVPAETRQVTRQVIDQPASLREEIIPPVFKTVTREVVDRPASVREIDVPAVYETISRQVKVEDARVERRAVLCDTNATPAKIREIQSALREAGFYRGPLDGRISTALMDAVTRFQRERKLPVDDGRVINLETLKALKVSPI